MAKNSVLLVLFHVCFLEVIICLRILSIFVTAEDGLLVNGNFEKAGSENRTSWRGANGVDSLPGWSIEGTVEYINEGQRQGSMYLVVPEGKHAVRLGNEAQISQPISLQKGSTYSLTFSAARTCAQLESLNVTVPPATRNVDLQTLYSIFGWDAYAWAFQAQSENVEVIFQNPGLEEDPTCGPILDAIALKQISTPEKLKDNAVVNGDFEEGPWMFDNETLGVLLPTNLDVTTSSLPGWIVESSKAVRYIDSAHYTVPEGKRAIELLSGKEGIISQMVETNPGSKYTMSFLLGEAGDGCQEPMAVMAFAGDESDSVHFNNPPASGKYEPNNVTFTAKAERTRIAFYSLYYNTRIRDKSSLCGPVIDQVKVVDLSKSGAVAAFSGFSLFLLLLVTVSTMAFTLGNV